MRRPVSTPGCLSGCRFAVKRFALGPSGRRFGDGGADDPLGCGEVGAGPRCVRDGGGAVLLEASVEGGVVGDAVLPAAPQDSAPGASDGTDCARVVLTAGPAGGVFVLGPGVPVAGRVGEGAGRLAQSVVAAVSEARDLFVSGFRRRRGSCRRRRRGVRRWGSGRGPLRSRPAGSRCRSRCRGF
jgi:hypothetical protein